ncbi:major facilitator superfamily domain-containing protein [Xylariaceae sp. FL0662B]|nr:major facilitator superfamily domain-containing protein [Xylariaceae sp. FL0662B]
MARSAVELDDLNVNSLNTTVEQRVAQPSGIDSVSGQDFSLPPVDTGKDAWLFLAACWTVEALVWGFGFSFGIFQDYYSNHEQFLGAGNIAVIGTSTLGIMYMGTPIVIALCRLYPRTGRWFTLAGLLAASITIGLSSLCTTVIQLIATQGVLFAIGGCFAYCPCILYIDEWFVQRKGMAFGIMWSVAGFGGVVLPLLFEVLLTSYGFPTALRIWAGILAIMAIPLSFFVKPRLPPSAVTNFRPFNIRFVISKGFLLHQLANIVQATGYFLPGIYLPSFARATFGTSTFLSTLTLLLVNISATMGSVIMGSMTDKLQTTTCIVISAIGASTGTLLIWGFSSSLGVLYAFCILYGLFAGCWTSIWPGIMRDIAKRGEPEGQHYTDPIIIFGLLCAGRGLGNIVSGPLSETLVKGMTWKGQAIGSYGSGYGPLIIYTGITALLAGSSFVWKHLNLL